MKTNHIIAAIGDKMPQSLEACQETIAILCFHLLSVWQQYNTTWGSTKDNEVGHACMTAGEDACDTLEGLGILEDQGYYAKITEPFYSAYEKGLWE